MELKELNKFLETRSYMSGYAPTSADAEEFKNLSAVDEKKFPHVARFYRHIASFTDSERSAWPKGTVEAAAAEEDVDFGDDDDLFGDDDEEDAAAAAAIKAKMEAKKKEKEAAKPSARSLVVLEVKPFDAETDLEALAKNIKALEHEGIQNWGDEHKFVPIAFGIKKLVISAVVFDDKILIDDMIDLINNKYEDDVQSIDVAAMSKV